MESLGHDELNDFRETAIMWDISIIYDPSKLSMFHFASLLHIDGLVQERHNSSASAPIDIMFIPEVSPQTWS